MKIIKIALTTLFSVMALQGSQNPEKNTANNERALTKTERLGHFALGCGKAAVSASIIVAAQSALDVFGIRNRVKSGTDSAGKDIWTIRYYWKPYLAYSRQWYLNYLLVSIATIWGCKEAAQSSLASFRKAFSK